MLVEADLSHAPAMAGIHAACFAGADCWDARAMSDLLGMPGCFGLIERTGGLILARLAAGEAEILTLAVVPDARRTRIATSLLAATLARTGPAPVFLEVAGTNAPAMALYARHGFERCGIRRRYYPDGSDALVLRRA